VPTPNERYTEILFLHYVLSALPGPVELYTPSTREEYVAGYDAKIVGEGLKELYLQFKRPAVDSPQLHFQMTLTAHQHQRLLYGLNSLVPGSVYYVSHTFTSIRHLNETIRRSTQPLELLAYYLAFTIAALSDDAHTIHYHLTGAPQQQLFQPPHTDAWYEQRGNGDVGPAYPILRCDRLVEDFQRGETGALVYGTELSMGRNDSLSPVKASQEADQPYRLVTKDQLSGLTRRSGRYPYETILRMPLAKRSANATSSNT
jgi:hypothetical protein